MRLRAPLLAASLCLACAPAPALAPALAPAPAAAAAAAPPPAPLPPPPIDPSAVRAEGISAHVRFLSDDLLEGRFTGSRGHAIAERYVATQLQALGVEPGGDAGSFLQAVPLRGATKDPARTSLVLRSPGKPDAALRLDEDFVLTSDLRTPGVDVTAPLVFVGYGVTAPEYGHDDLAGVDLRGKIAVLFLGAPLSDRDDYFPPIAHAIYSDHREKVVRLAERGAVGVLTVYRPEDEERLPWVRAAKLSHLEQMSWLRGGEPGASAAGAPLRGTLHWKAFDAVLSRAGVQGGTAALTEAAGRRALRALELRASLHGKLSSRFRELESHNVVGVLRGSDPGLRVEHVVYSAHLDHLGVGAPIDGDAIYNGALDNASGTAAILEIARAYAMAPRRPARSILFLACTGEERGLLGSDYFARFPTVPAGSIVADLNDDMVLALGPVRDVVALGAQHSTLGPLAVEAARSLGLETSPDPEPQQNHFIRSDQFSFVRQGIPSLMVVPGLKDERGLTEVYAARRKDWIARRYHAPADQWEAGYDYEGMAKVARVELLVGFAAASAGPRPSWGKGDLLAARFAKGP